MPARLESSRRDVCIGGLNVLLYWIPPLERIRVTYVMKISSQLPVSRIARKVMRVVTFSIGSTSFGGPVIQIPMKAGIPRWED